MVAVRDVAIGKPREYGNSMGNIESEKSEFLNRRCVSFVKGYLYDYPVPGCIGMNWHKFEIIQHPCCTEKPTQTSFDYELSIEIIRGIVEFFPACTCTVEMDSDIKLKSFEEYYHHILNQKKIDEDPVEDAELDWPEKISVWNSDGKMVLYGRLQPWAVWGGEYPYNDAFSYEFYFEKDIIDEFQNHYITLFMRKHIFIHEILCGSRHGKQIKSNGIFQGFRTLLMSICNFRKGGTR